MMSGLTIYFDHSDHFKTFTFCIPKLYQINFCNRTHSNEQENPNWAVENDKIADELLNLQYIGRWKFGIK